MDSTKILAARDAYFKCGSKSSFKSGDKLSSISIESCEDIFKHYDDNIDFMEKEENAFVNLQTLKQQLPLTLES